MAGKIKVAVLPMVVTANRLRDGRVVWLSTTTADRWNEQVSQATLFAPADAQAGLEQGLADERTQLVVGVYAAEAQATGNGPVPLRNRERIRAYGPSVAYTVDNLPQTNKLDL